MYYVLQLTCDVNSKKKSKSLVSSKFSYYVGYLIIYMCQKRNLYIYDRIQYDSQKKRYGQFIIFT